MAQWTDTGKETRLDTKHRVNLGAAVMIGVGARYRVMKNELGQILLDPVKSVPAYEAWLWDNQERVASVQRGIAEAEAGKLVTRDLGDVGEDEDE